MKQILCIALVAVMLTGCGNVSFKEDNNSIFPKNDSSQNQVKN